MKKLFIIGIMCLFLLAGQELPAQTNSGKPDFQEFCNDIGLGFEPDNKEKFDTKFEERLWEVSGADPQTASDREAKTKINKMWDRHKLDFKCGTMGRSILKYLIEGNVIGWLTRLANKYELDINFVDPRDNQNVLEYLNQEIKRKDDVAGAKDHYSSDLLRTYRDKLIRAGALTTKQIANPEFTTAEQFFKPGESLFLERQDRRAEIAFTKAIEINPKYADAYTARGMVRIKRSTSEDFGNDDPAQSSNADSFESMLMESAVEDFTKAIELNSIAKAKGVNYFHRASAYKHLLKLDLAAADLSKSIELHPSADAYKMRAEIYCQQNKKANAAADEKKATELGGKVEAKCRQ